MATEVSIPRTNVCGLVDCPVCMSGPPQPKVPVQCNALLPCPTCQRTTEHLFSVIVDQHDGELDTQSICHTCWTSTYADVVTRSVYRRTVTP